jgi:hypothetical protein
MRSLRRTARLGVRGDSILSGPQNLMTMREKADISTLLSADISALLLQPTFANRMLWNMLAS